jgi:hypothetical protein
LIVLKKRATILALENDVPIDLTLHGFSASLVTEFANKIVKPYYNGNLSAAFQDLIHKTIAEQDFVSSHLTHIQTSVEV